MNADAMNSHELLNSICPASLVSTSDWFSREYIMGVLTKVVVHVRYSAAEPVQPSADWITAAESGVMTSAPMDTGTFRTPQGIRTTMVGNSFTVLNSTCRGVGTTQDKSWPGELPPVDVKVLHSSLPVNSPALSVEVRQPDGDCIEDTGLEPGCWAEAPPHPASATARIKISGAPARFVIGSFPSSGI